MIDGMPLIDVHLHAARLPTLKPAWKQWAHDFGDEDILDRVYDSARPAAAPPRPDRNDPGMNALILLERTP